MNHNAKFTILVLKFPYRIWSAAAGAKIGVFPCVELDALACDNWTSSDEWL